MSDIKDLEENTRKQMGRLKICNKSYPIYEGLNIIGRDLKATVRVTELKFSKQHAILSVIDDSTHLISDFGSSNGTEVRRNKLIPYKFYKIHDREPIIFGDVVGIYYLCTDSELKTQNDSGATQSQVVDHIASTQLITQNLHDQPTQPFDNPLKIHMVHEAATQALNKSDNIHDLETQLLPGCSKSSVTCDKVTTDLRPGIEVDLDLSKSELYDDVFANESFRLSLQQNCSSRYNIEVDETLPTDAKLDKSVAQNNNMAYLDDDDIILSTQEDAMIDRQALESIMKTQKTQSSKEGEISKVIESKKKIVTINIDDDDSETDMEDEEVFLKNLQQKSTQLDNSKDDKNTTESKNKDDNSDSETDVEDDLLLKNAVQEPTHSDSDTEVEDNILANLPTPENNEPFNNRDEIKSNKVAESDEEEELDLLAPTQKLQEAEFLVPALQSKYVSSTENKHHEDDDDLPPTQLLQNKNIEKQGDDDLFLAPKRKDESNRTQINDEDIDLLAPTQLLDSTNNKEINDDDDHLPPTQLLQSKNPENKLQVVDDVELPPTQLLEQNDSIFSALTQKLDKNRSSPRETSILSAKSSNNKTQEVEDEDDLPPTQLLVQKPDDSIFSAPTQIIEKNKSQKKTSILSTKSSNNKTQEVEDEDDLPPTQLLVQKPDDSIFSAPTQIIEKNKSQQKTSILSTKSSNNKTQEVDDEDDLPPTQLLVQKPDDSIFLAPTQILDKNKSQKKSSTLSTKSFNNKTQEVEDEDDLPPTQLLVQNPDDSIFSAPTQKLNSNVSSPRKKLSLLSTKSSNSKIKEVDDDDLPPTQLLQNINQNKDDDNLAPTQILEKTDPNIVSPLPKRSSILNTNPPRNKEKRSVNFSEMVSTNDNEENSKRNNMKNLNKSLQDPNDSDSSSMSGVYLLNNSQESLKLILSETDDEIVHESTKKQDISVLNKIPENIPESETQLEVDFCMDTQKLYVEARTSRPDNPIGNMFAEEPTQMTENIIENKQSENTEVEKLEAIENSRRLEVRLLNIKDITEASGSKSDERDIKEEKPKRGRKKKIDTDQNITKLNVTRVKNNINQSKETVETKQSKDIVGTKQSKETVGTKQLKKTVETKQSKETVETKQSKETVGTKQLKKTVETKQSKETVETKQSKEIVETRQQKKNQQQNDSLKSSETDEDNKLHNTRGKRVSYQQLNSGNPDKKKTRGASKSSASDKSEKDEEVKETKRSTRMSERRMTRDTLKTPKKETLKDKINENSSDMDDFITHRTRTSKRTHKEENPVVEVSDDDSVSSPPTYLKKKVLKLQYTEDSEPSSTNSSVVRKSPKRSMQIEDYSSDENINNNTTSATICLNTPNTKRRKYEPLNVTVSNSQSSNSSRESMKHKVVFTMLNDTKLENSVKKLGGSVIDSIQACTVLVTNKISRSLKFLLAVTLGKPIVQSNWIHESVKNNCFQDPWNYLLEDHESEEKFNFKLNKSLIKSAEKKLLTNTLVLIATKKNYDVLKDVIEASGGKCIARAPARNGKAIVVSYEEEKAKYSKYLKQKSLTVVSAEAIFSGVLQQELNLEQHLLS